MNTKRLGLAAKTLLAAFFLLSLSLAVLTGCASKKLADQNDAQMGAIVESIQANFAEEGWSYTGFEVLGTDKENDTATVEVAYAVEGDAEDALKAHASEKPSDDSVYDLAENVNVKVVLELSAYDKDNDALGCSLVSTTWFVGGTEADEWIREQSKS